MDGCRWGADGVEPYLLDSSYDGLCEGVDERVEHLVGVCRAEQACPQMQGVDILPIIHSLACLLKHR